MLVLLAVMAATGGEVLEARLEAAVSEGRDVAVRLAYGIEASGTERIAFSILEMEGAAVEEVAAFASETPLEVELAPRKGPKREGWIFLPKGTSALELRYVVRNAAERTSGGLRVWLPCAIVGLRLQETRPGLFTSTVELPPGLSITDGFPSQSVAAGGGAYRWELPLVPAFLAFRASSGFSLFTPPRAATTAVMAVLLATGLIGVRRARAHRA